MLWYFGCVCCKNYKLPWLALPDKKANRECILGLGTWIDLGIGIGWIIGKSFSNDQ
ncbi:hypothetical protein [Trichormus variabilis]|uniref:hypothetical protein n=1 Tax=Anabaena variabilis TaxID=264691 RepID=UPI001688A403|nr:hypothetical protein [Trichormus variabilis]MBD2629468.1 hypothetical protein [Trichormus variabilis FACHB-164]